MTAEIINLAEYRAEKQRKEAYDLLRDGIGNLLYDSVNRLIGGFPYQIDTKLDKGVVIFEEEIK